MSAHEQMRAMLHELMGTSSQEGRPRRNFTNSSVCKPFLLSCCVHEIFEATRMNIGVCNRIHDVRLRADYEKARARQDFGYELEVTNNLKAFLADRDRRVEIAKRKLLETQEQLPKPISEKETELNELKSKLDEKIGEAERLGEQGLVEDSLKVMEEVTDLTKQIQETEHEIRNALPPLSYQQQKMRVCEVCTSLLGAQDNDRRLADHFGGKLHLGYLTVNDKFEELQERVSKQSEESATSVAKSASSEEDARTNERYERRRKRIREGRQSYGKERNRNRRDYRSRSRSRSRSRDYRRGSHPRHSESRSYKN